MKRQNDYIDFVTKFSDSPSSSLDSAILIKVKEDLLPSRGKVLLKLLSLQALVGVLTMLFCPQFTLSLTNSYDLFHFFHHTFGRYVCMAICGSIFVGSGAYVSGLILTTGDMNRVRESRLLTYTFVSGLAITLFLILGSVAYLNLALVWFISSTIAGAVSIEAGHFSKNQIAALTYKLEN